MAFVGSVQAQGTPLSTEEFELTFRAGQFAKTVVVEINVNSGTAGEIIAEVLKAHEKEIPRDMITNSDACRLVLCYEGKRTVVAADYKAENLDGFDGTLEIVDSQTNVENEDFNLCVRPK